jgi:hypothetical protein
MPTKSVDVSRDWASDLVEAKGQMPGPWRGAPGSFWKRPQAERRWGRTAGDATDPAAAKRVETTGH